MKVEYEEFENVEDIFMFMSTAAPPMKNTIPINSYKGHVLSLIPLSTGTGNDIYKRLTRKWNL
jgi:hypothetical protein